MNGSQLLQPSDLGLILSYRCQSACAHCLYNCSPHWAEWITTEKIDHALEATSFWHHPYQVHITGGEPFLNYPLLLHAVRTASKRQIPVYVETNAGWCVNEEIVSRHFTELIQAELQAILISVSPFHAASISPERTLLAIRVALDIFGPSRVIIYQYDWLKEILQFGESQPIPLSAYMKIHGEEQAGKLFWHGYGLISGGRSAYTLGHLVEKHSVGCFARQNCRQEILFAPHSHFDLYGNYIPGFCGGISVGSWSDLPRLTSDFRSHHYPPLVATLIESGPYGLYQMAAKDFNYRPVAEGYVGKCHLCVDVRRHLVERAAFAELRPLAFYSQDNLASI